MFTCDNLGVNHAGHLTFASQDTTALAARYGTPLYLLDEDRIRQNCRVFLHAMRQHFPKGSLPLYAGKANAFRDLYRIMSEEGMGIDVVSCGEIHTAALAGYDLSNAYFHGNCKTDEDIAFAMDHGVGAFIVDNVEELDAVNAAAEERGERQKILLRLTPGIDPHTYEAVNTGKVDSKFGVAIETGQAEELTSRALKKPHIDLAGFHCHVGSQVFAEDVFERAARIMLEFIADMRRIHGFTARQLDLGGGFGTRYVASDPEPDLDGRLASIARAVHDNCTRLGIDEPEILLEPGRSIVADAGLTLYTVGAVKHIPGYRSYAIVDGGMTDNPRYALYRSAYTCLPASRMDEPRPFLCTVAGRCCESGDLIQENVPLPEDIRRGDLLAVCTTGAYNYSMASNYNRVPRAPVVLLRRGESRLAVRREAYSDLTRLDL